MNQEISGVYNLLFTFICYGVLMGAFLRFLKAHLESTKAKEALFAIFFFTGFTVAGVLCERGILPVSLCRLLENGLFVGLVMLAFLGAWEKKLLVAAILMAAKKLIVNFCGSFLEALTLVIRHGILKQSAMMIELWQEYLIAVLSFLTAAAAVCFLSKKSDGLFEEKTGKWYLMAAGPLFFMILVVDAYDWSVSKGVLFWGGQNLGLYENQLFSHGAVCIMTALCMFAAGFYVYGMHKIQREWQKKEQYRLQTIYLEGLKEQNEQMDKIRHDMKNHIISLQGLLASGNLERLEEYLNRIAETGGIKGAEEVTGNKAVDALLYEKRKRAEEKNIIWRCDMQPWQKSAMDEFDFCVLAGNALDNAINACERMEYATDRFIHIQTGWVKNYFLFEVKNSADVKVVEEVQHSAPGSKKAEGKHDGIGLLNIKETVQKYNGIVNIEIKDKVFIISVLIPVE